MRAKIILLITMTCLLAATPLRAQTLLNNPESIVYDAPRSRYIVSNWGDGKIVQIDSEGNESYFDTTFTRLAGLYILHDTLYVATNLDPYVGMAGFDLAADTLAFFIEIESSGLTNDITSDSSNNIYVTDFYDSKLYKIREGERSYTTFVDEGLNWPNGIIYDRFNHRLLLISQHEAGGPILAVNTANSTVSFVAYTGFTGVDGLEMDHEGRLYFSTWQTDATLRFDADYSQPPEVVVPNNLDPADIYINPVDSTLCIPNFSRNNITYFPLVISEVEEHSHLLPERKAYNYPNPFNQSTTICVTLEHVGAGTIRLYNLLGQLRQELGLVNHTSGLMRLPLDGSTLATGTYIAILRHGDQQEQFQMTLIK